MSGVPSQNIATAMSKTGDSEEVKLIIDKHKDAARLARAMAGNKPGE